MTLDERLQHALDHGYGRLYRGRVIPIISGGSEDEDAGDGDAGGSGSASGERTFSQADVDRIVQDRVARVKRETPADYEELKTAKVELDKIRAAQLSDAEKKDQRISELERQLQDTTLREQETRLRSAIIAEAAGKFTDPSDAVALLDRSQIEFDDDGAPKNVADVVGALLDAKPHLAAGGSRGGSADQGARAGSSVKQLDRNALKSMSPEQITQARREGRLDKILGG